jgi:hypothetical protein
MSNFEGYDLLPTKKMKLQRLKMTKLDELKSIYPGALAWHFGDSPELAD